MKVSNNLIATIVMVWIVASSINLLAIHQADKITGKVTNTGIVHICIGSGGGATLIPIYPDNTNVLNGTILAVVKEVSVTTNYSGRQVFVYYSYSNNPKEFIGNDTYDGDEFYASYWNTTNVSDGNCNYKLIYYYVLDCNQAFPDYATASWLTVNNYDEEPGWDNFKNNLTTNFSQYSSWINIQNATIGLPDKGIINFTGNSMNFDGMDIDSAITIDHNLVDVDKNNFPCLIDAFTGNNVTITLYNLSFIIPGLYKDNLPCDPSICNMIDYTNGTLTFTAKYLGRLYAVENASLSINISMDNKTYDNSPSFNVTTFYSGNNITVPANATCYYKTDYNPADYTLMQFTGNSTTHTQTLPEQSFSYVAVPSPNIYANIEHHNYINNTHSLYVNCTSDIKNTAQSINFQIIHPKRDKVYYLDNYTIALALELEESGLNLTADFSAIDSNYSSGKEIVVNSGLNYTIYYNISGSNIDSDGQKQIKVEARNSTALVMNATILAYLHNNWTKPDVDYAFMCWNYNPGWYFDEVGCDWESDLNHAADRKDSFSVEEICDDNIDNDGDALIDCNDNDCSGLLYSCRWNQSISSAFIEDPCVNNICTLCLGGAENSSGVCSTENGVTIKYTQYARPGEKLKVLYSKSALNGKTVSLSINEVNESFYLSSSTSSIRQLPTKLIGCAGRPADQCISVTASSYINETNNKWYNALDEQIEIKTPTVNENNSYPNLLIGKSIEGIAAYTNLQYFEVKTNAIVNESNYINLSGYAEWCIDGIDNDLDSFISNGIYSVDCHDIDCNNSLIGANIRCEYGNERNCSDNFDNDGDGYTDCFDQDCFKNNLACPFVETVCNDTLNNDYDYGIFGNSSISLSYQNRGNYTLALTDCIDIDCNNSIGGSYPYQLCEYYKEMTCNDNFDNDADGYYDCTGNAYRVDYERDCDRWHSLSYVCPLIETICNDDIDNDLDSDYLLYNASLLGGYDCQDIDCDGLQGGVSPNETCQYANETECEDNFDNDADGDIDCWDYTSCWGSSGVINHTGECKPCAAIENISLDSCANGKDDDYDGSTDCSDTDCAGEMGPDGVPCGTSEICTDRIDNDGDGLIDEFDYLDCPSANELGAGQCKDSVDNDNDGNADCSDSDCVNTSYCISGGYDLNCEQDGMVGSINVCHADFIHRGDNLTVTYSKSSTNYASLWLKLGNVDYSLTQTTPAINSTTTFMIGTTTNFVKVEDTYGLKAQNIVGFSGNLNLSLVSTSATNTTPGNYNLFVSTSVPGSYGEKTISVYVSENEIPVISNVDVSANGNNITLRANVTDDGTYNSGIEHCEFNITGSWITRNNCIYEGEFANGTHTVYVRAIDGAGNPSSIYSKSFNVSETPVQNGPFINTQGTPNYPDREHFTGTQDLGITVYFNSSAGFTPSTTGCNVTIYDINRSIMSSHMMNLSIVLGMAKCDGIISLNNISNAAYTFDVGVRDNSGAYGKTSMQSIYVCKYLKDNSTGEYYCMDICEEIIAANNPPYLIANFPDKTWPEDTTLTGVIGYGMDDYFADPDGDILTYNTSVVNNIRVTFDQNNIVSFTPDKDWYGVRTIVFYSYDPYGLYATSNVITLTVLDVPEPAAPPPSGGGGGGGRAIPQICVENWQCGDWGECLSTGIQVRECYDAENCTTSQYRPRVTRQCGYQPTCTDGIKNHGEAGVDCGGPCPPCPTCFDKIKNQGETAIDCGGPCPHCVTCSDGIKNQGEEKVDCGGPCKPCPAERIPLGILGIFAGLRLTTALSLLAILLLLLLFLLYPLIEKLLKALIKLISELLAARPKKEKEELDLEHFVVHRAQKLREKELFENPLKANEYISETMQMFLKAFLDWDHEFTSKELRHKMKEEKIPVHISEKICEFYDKIESISFSGRMLSKEELEQLIKETEALSYLAIKEHWKAKIKKEKAKNIKRKFKVRSDEKGNVHIVNENPEEKT